MKAEANLWQAQRLAQMRRIATGLLFAMGAVFICAHLYEPAYPALAFVRAFAEAAMVGALADWFAVTALFRHPLGIPIPHTAILPRKKDRLGENLGKFVEQNFLATNVVAEKIAGSDYAGPFGRWLAEPRQASRIAAALVSFLPKLLGAFDRAPIQHFIKQQVLSFAGKIDIAPLAAHFLTSLTVSDRHQQLLTAVIGQLSILLDANKPTIREKVEREVWWVLRKLAIDEKIYHKIVDAVEEYLREVRDAPDHPMRARFDASLAEFIVKLETSPEYREKGEAIKQQLLQSPALHGYLEGLWDDIRNYLTNDAARPDSVVRGRIESALVHLGSALARDQVLHDRINQWLRELIVETVREHGHHAANFIADVVRRWDTDTVTEKIELEVGRDLQYIRINGTLIGGLVGLIIYTASLFF